jgi:hypothetical protein
MRYDASKFQGRISTTHFAVTEVLEYPKRDFLPNRQRDPLRHGLSPSFDPLKSRERLVLGSQNRLITAPSRPGACGFDAVQVSDPTIKYIFLVKFLTAMAEGFKKTREG